ncbi:uncharacterized protein LOC114935633 isoform X2 [Nylanderia fulva]|uniref:uncharacterized protein LOC114935633 isoform X2 n=1 Tax=Nylanderia fulva TaxID=613905 RepID=UPI0010FB9DDB|nr:uncharacterized protein LOC114935633 isoform X2 [Nylanderia fulva]
MMMSSRMIKCDFEEMISKIEITNLNLTHLLITLPLGIYITALYNTYVVYVGSGDIIIKVAQQGLRGDGISLIAMHRLQAIVLTSVVSTEFEKDTIPFCPLKQLMGVFSADSKKHLSAPWVKLMIDPKSHIIDFYPEDFNFDLNGKKFVWQGVALLPFVDEKNYLKLWCHIMIA